MSFLYGLSWVINFFLNSFYLPSQQFKKKKKLILSFIFYTSLFLFFISLQIIPLSFFLPKIHLKLSKDFKFFVKVLNLFFFYPNPCILNFFYRTYMKNVNKNRKEPKLKTVIPYLFKLFVR